MLSAWSYTHMKHSLALTQASNLYARGRLAAQQHHGTRALALWRAADALVRYAARHQALAEAEAFTALSALATRWQDRVTPAIVDVAA